MTGRSLNLDRDHLELGDEDETEWTNNWSSNDTCDSGFDTVSWDSVLTGSSSIFTIKITRIMTKLTICWGVRKSLYCGLFRCCIDQTPC